MKYLLDTCVLLWALAGEEDQIASFMPILQDPRNYVAVSVVNYWEIAMKKSLNKLKAPNNIVEVVEETGFTWLNLELKHIKQLEHLPHIHNDPFDRLLVAQAQADGFELLTTDKTILRYFEEKIPFHA